MRKQFHFRDAYCGYILDREVSWTRQVHLDETGARVAKHSPRKRATEKESVTSCVFARNELVHVESVLPRPRLLRILCICTVRKLQKQALEILKEEWRHFNGQLDDWEVGGDYSEKEEGYNYILIGQKLDKLSPMLRDGEFSEMFSMSYILHPTFGSVYYSNNEDGLVIQTGRKRITKWCTEGTFLKKLREGSLFLSDLHGINFFPTEKYGEHTEVNQDMPRPIQNEARRYLNLFLPLDDIEISPLKESDYEFIRGKQETSQKYFTAYSKRHPESPHIFPETEGVPRIGQFRSLAKLYPREKWWVEINMQDIFLIRDHGCIDILRHTDNKFQRYRLHPARSISKGFAVISGKFYFRGAPLWDWNPKVVETDQGTSREVERRKRMLKKAREIAKSR